MLRRKLINLDLWAGRGVALKLPAYIEERWSVSRQGSYTAEEWSHARMAGYRGNEAGRPLLDTEEGYRHQLANHNAPAVQAANRLAVTLNFRRYNSVLEIGAGEMAQAFTLTNLFPHLRDRATDFDPFVIEKCRGLPLLNRIEKSILDASRIVASDLAGFDLLTGWKIIHALDEPVLHTVLSACHEVGVLFMAATSQLLGPLRYFRRTWRDTAWGLHSSVYQGLVSQRLLRMHGWNSSLGYYLGYYRRQARQTGMKLARFWLPPTGATDNFSFLLFEPVRS